MQTTSRTESRLFAVALQLNSVFFCVKGPITPLKHGAANTHLAGRSRRPPDQQIRIPSVENVPTNTKFGGIVNRMYASVYQPPDAKPLHGRFSRRGILGPLPEVIGALSRPDAVRWFPVTPRVLVLEGRR